MKFKSDIEVQAGLRDGSDDIGTAGQLLSSTGTITNWIDQGEVVAAGATKVLIACKNTSGGTITKGTPVYQTGNVGATDVIEIAEADALISTGYLPAIGLLETDLINNAFGNVVITGELLNITTDPIDGLTPTTGDAIYLKSGGGLTLTKPTGEGNAIQNLGLVGKVSGGNAGSITVASIMRQNDVPNLPTGKIWVGDGNTIVSDVVYLDETNERMGIGTTTPSYKLDVSGDAYIDETLNIETTISGTLAFGYGGVGAGHLVVGGNNFASFTPAVITLMNQDTTISAGQDLGVLQFGGKDDQTNGYANGQIICTTAVGAGSGNTGGGIFRFLLSGNTTGSGPSEKMRITNTGNVGIGTTNPRTKLHVSGLTGDDDPALGSSTAPLFISNTANSYGLNVGVNNVGASWLQAQSNTSSIAYEMSLNPLGGNVGVGQINPSEKLEVNGSVKATASTDAYKGYIKQSITCIANEKADSANYNLVPYNTLNTVNSDQYYNRMVAAYDGRIKKVYIRNTGGTPTADTVNFKKQVNNTTAATVYSATVANAASAGMSAVYNFADNDFTFNEGDTFGILYQTTNSGGGSRSMAGVAINIIVEYNIT